MVSLPSYDNNILTDPVDQERLPGLLNDPTKPMLNHAISEVNPPGSTFKHGHRHRGAAGRRRQPEHDHHEQRLDQRRRTSTRRAASGSCATGAALGTMDFYHGLAMSSDVYFYYLSGGYYDRAAEKSSTASARTASRSYARDVRLRRADGHRSARRGGRQRAGPDWKEENVGEVWTLGDTYNFGIGQGYLTVTPMQLMRVTAAIANGGDLLVPHVVQRGRRRERQRAAEDRARRWRTSCRSRKQNFTIMREAMRQAAVYGPAQTGASSQVTIAAKTGTAEFGIQLPDGRYMSSHAWYTGYAPSDNPEIAVVVFLEKGIGATNGGPVAKQIFDYYFGRKNQAQGQTP